MEMNWIRKLDYFALNSEIISFYKKIKIDLSHINSLKKHLLKKKFKKYIFVKKKFSSNYLFIGMLRNKILEIFQ
jgi:3-deoxy-D-arabino-heptulosonate 7-phosphate (DAHP) synthase